MSLIRAVRRWGLLSSALLVGAVGVLGISQVQEELIASGEFTYQIELDALSEPIPFGQEHFEQRRQPSGNITFSIQGQANAVDPGALSVEIPPAVRATLTTLSQAQMRGPYTQQINYSSAWIPQSLRGEFGTSAGRLKVEARLDPPLWFVRATLEGQTFDASRLIEFPDRFLVDPVASNSSLIHVLGQWLQTHAPALNVGEQVEIMTFNPLGPRFPPRTLAVTRAPDRTLQDGTGAGRPVTVYRVRDRAGSGPQHQVFALDGLMIAIISMAEDIEGAFRLRAFRSDLFPQGVSFSE